VTLVVTKVFSRLGFVRNMDAGFGRPNLLRIFTKLSLTSLQVYDACPWLLGVPEIASSLILMSPIASAVHYWRKKLFRWYTIEWTRSTMCQSM